MKHVCSGLAFGATRKLATLRRTCERLSCLMDVINTSYFGGVITSTHGKRNLMKLSQWMVKTFCSSINGQQVMISGMNDLDRIWDERFGISDPGHPNSIVVSAATTISVPFASVEVFNFFRDGRNRPLWHFFLIIILSKRLAILRVDLIQGIVSLFSGPRVPARATC
ncbi:homeobox-leucine zipper protein HDG12-like [Apium graveolens]|uniref:homeobox-leucine zipper protein HDG12-like n=1 Tax=Apium graveolens TaxID=4045 RepID=UPI003D7C06C4